MTNIYNKEQVASVMPASIGPNGRRCSPVNAIPIPITEKLLLSAGGWLAMKPARELLKRDRVSEAKYEPPLLSGYLREDAKNYRSGLRIKSALDVDIKSIPSRVLGNLTA